MTPSGASRLLEVCVDSVEGAHAAAEGGAGRLELCADLLEGGVTPSAGMIELVTARCEVPVHVMVRPRGGDFLYGESELQVMKRDIEYIRSTRARGVVLGLLTRHGDIDLERTARLIECARPLSVTFHRAFDMCRGPFEALEALVGLGVERVLSSGQERTALEGADLLRALIERAANRIVVMPGAGITERNVRKILAQTGAAEVHVSGRSMAESRMEYRNPRCAMGGELPASEYACAVTDGIRVRAFVEALRADL